MLVALVEALSVLCLLLFVLCYFPIATYFRLELERLFYENIFGKISFVRILLQNGWNEILEIISEPCYAFIKPEEACYT